MKITLLAQNKIEFIDESCSKTNVNSPLLQQGERCNAVVRSGGTVYSSIKDLKLLADLITSN